MDHHLMVLCRPHYKPPSALLPVGIYGLPLSQGSTKFKSCRHVRDISFTPHDPSLLLACTSDDALLAFDMNAGAFFSETQLLAERTGAAKSKHNAACVHVNRCPAAPLVFAGSPEGDVLIFDIRISGINAKFSGRKVCPAIRLPAAHDGALCGIRTGLALHSHLFLTGGREDRWIRIFDLRFPLHYSSGGSSCQKHVSYPLEAIRLGPSENENRFRNCLMALDVSPDGSLLAASVARCHSGKLPSVDAIPKGDGETVLLSLRDGAHTLKTIASADACAAEFIQFSLNGKYILQTGGVSATHCRLCWRCSCDCSCESQTWQGSIDLSGKATTRSGQYCVSNSEGSGENSVAEQTIGDELRDQMPHGDGLPNHHSLSVRRCSYHRAQLVNLVQSNRTVNLKSPADSAIAFTDSFCLSHSPRRPESSHGGATQLGPFTSGDAALVSCGQPLALCVAGNCDISSQLNFTLHGPQSDHVQRSRQRFWDYLSGLQNQSVTTSAKGTGVYLLRDSTVQLPGTRSGGRQESEAGITPEYNSRKLPLINCVRDTDQPTANIVEKHVGEGVVAIANKAHSASTCLLFPLLHPQLSQFITACGPLHPAFVRAEAATFPFTCRLWGGLVVGFGGSTADHYNRCRRLYEGLKLWDSTTGVVLSWTEGYLASEDSLRCLAPLPDLSSGLIATGSSMPFNTRTRNAAPSEGVTIWAVRRRDDLLLSALDGALHLTVE